MTPSPNTTDRQGFTLLELLITITILGVVMVILAQAATLSIQTWEKGRTPQFTSQQTAAVTNILSEQLRSTYPLRIPIRKDDGSVDSSKKLLVFDGGPESIAFVTTKPLGIETQGGLHLVVYYLEREKGSSTSDLIAAHRSVYHRLFYETPFTDHEKTRVLSEVSKLTIEYYDDKSGSWLPQWIIQDPTQLTEPDLDNPDEPLPKTMLPAAVKLHLEYGSTHSLVTSDLVIPIMAQGEEDKTARSRNAAVNAKDDEDDEDDEDD